MIGEEIVINYIDNITEKTEEEYYGLLYIKEKLRGIILEYKKNILKENIKRKYEIEMNKINLIK